MKLTCLYHSLRNSEDLSSILSENILRIGVQNCVCFTRSSLYMKSWRKIRLVLDYNRLKQDYKITPNNHYYFEYRELFKTNDLREHDEMEERIYKDIKNLTRYLIRIEINNEIT